MSNSRVVAKVDLRKTMKETRSQTMELYDKVGIIFKKDKKQNQRDILAGAI